MAKELNVILILLVILLMSFGACSGGNDKTVQTTLKPTATEAVSTNPPHPPAATAMDFKKIDLSIGQKLVFEYFEGGVAIGTDECSIAEIAQDTGSSKYKIRSHLKLGKNSIWGDYESHAYLSVDELFIPSAYNAVEAIGCSSCQSTQQLVECNIKNNIASTSIWNNKDNETIEKTTVLEPATFLLSEKAVTWLAMMYRVLPLTKGESITIPIFYPDSFKATEMELSVRPNIEEIDLKDNTYEVFVCDIKSPGQIHYVNLEGRLLKVEFPESDIIIYLSSD